MSRAGLLQPCSMLAQKVGGPEGEAAPDATGITCLKSQVITDQPMHSICHLLYHSIPSTQQHSLTQQKGKGSKEGDLGHVLL